MTIKNQLNEIRIKGSINKKWLRATGTPTPSAYLSQHLGAFTNVLEAKVYEWLLTCSWFCVRENKGGSVNYDFIHILLRFTRLFS